MMEASSPRKRDRLSWKPLQGYSFYIDVDYDKEDEEATESVELLVGKIVSLGGIIRKMLSQNVSYFITAGNVRQRVKIRRSSRFLKQNETRAKTKLKNTQPVFKQDIVPATLSDRAKELGLHMFTVEKVSKWLTEIEKKKLHNQESPTCKKHCNEENQITSPENRLCLLKDDDTSQQSVGSLSHFKYLPNKNHNEELEPPFLKVEDIERMYEPQFIELDFFPIISYDTKAPRCPFQKKDLNGSISQKSAANSDKEEKSISSTSNYSKSGYCDFCESFFRCRDRHINTKKHQCNIPYENFKKLDDLIVNGVNFDEFLKSVFKKKNTQENTQENTQKNSIIGQVDCQKEFTDFLKSLDGKIKGREFFSDLNGFVDYSDKKKDIKSGLTDENGTPFIR